ncbi:MAG TPA: c(7)-type cytochrome triheme domain-containing protein [Dissulfurispiraceae bacterium]|nr:c(7)-type cytochrome triheme domain-containing protein [Dissulfurispiraceae bacterium]
MKRALFITLILLAVTGVALAQTGLKKKRLLPYEYGHVVINNYSENAHMAPVVFDHWFHRSQFTCRVCHVDLAFAMKAGATGIKAVDNSKGYYCGTCHNGKKDFGKRKVFAACSKEFGHKDLQRCERCHSLGKNVKKEHDFSEFASRMPKERFGNGINWEKAEELGLIKPVDFLEGISIRRPGLKVQKDFSLDPKVEGMPKIVFSHKKHTVWNGCELCHPEIFVGVKKGTTKYGMADIMQGKYCGVCHGLVAFPVIDCQRCHTEPVE